MKFAFTSCVVLLALLVSSSGCPHKVKVEPVEVKPIHMTIDVNIKVDRELDKFFDFEEQGEGETTGNEPKDDEDKSGHKTDREDGKTDE